jgi:outer membrane lipoprotein SlyB
MMALLNNYIPDIWLITAPALLMTGCASNPLENYDEYEMIQEYREVKTVMAYGIVKEAKQ